MKSFIFGIDGATFDIIKPMIEKGQLPNLHKLMQIGAYGELASTIPPHTAPGWVSAVTGVSPGNHGVYQFWDTQSPDYIGKFMGATDFNVPAVWDILERNGLKTGMINIPMTHPPKPVNGYIISWPLSNTLRYSYPSSLLSEIASNGGHYLPDLLSMFKGDLEYINEAISITKNRAKTVKYLMKKHPTDFLMVVFTEVDRVSHYYWHFFDKTSTDYVESVQNEKLRDAIYDMYIATDEVLGDILGELEKDCLTFVVSDHGFGCGKMNFYIQNFLRDNGLIKVKPSQKSGGKDGETSILELAQGNWMEFEENGIKYEVDLENTIAYMSAPGSYGININLEGRQKNGTVAKGVYQKTCDEIISLLEKVEDPNTGKKLFKRVVRSDEVYNGRATALAPDLILIPNDYGIMVHHQLTSGGWFSNPEQKGMHRENGVCIISGPDVMNTKIEGAALEDLVPTLLYKLKLPIPDYVKGKVLPIFSEEFVAHNSITVIKEDLKEKLITDIDRGKSYSEKEKDDIKKRLHSLGYL